MSQYSDTSISHYEAVFGMDFVSPGGYDTARDLVASMDLAPGSRVLDIGCGLGGCAFLLAQEFGCLVKGIDLSENMVARARAKLSAKKLHDQVSFECVDILKYNSDRSYDAVFSRDVFLHIGNKSDLLNRIRELLVAGGKLLFTDYARGPEPHCDTFDRYVSERGYVLHSAEEYAELIREAGFSDVEVRDCTEDFITILGHECSRIPDLGLPSTVSAALEASWNAKINHARLGDHRWLRATAVA